MVDTYNGILFSYEKEGNPAICDIMDGCWGHYAKWNKLDRERQNAAFTYGESKKKVKLIETDSRNSNRHAEVQILVIMTTVFLKFSYFNLALLRYNWHIKL